MPMPPFQNSSRGLFASASVATCALALMLGATTAQAQDIAFVKRPTALRASPGDSGAVVTPLEASTAVQRSTERKGAWIKVSTAQGSSGWVHMFDLGAPAGAAPASAQSGVSGAATAGLRGLNTLLGGNAGATTTATSTVGLRGLGAEDIAHAQPNKDAVQRAHQLRASDDQARQFASRASLQAHSVPPLAAPPSPVGQGGASGVSGPSSNPSDPNFSAN